MSDPSGGSAEKELPALLRQLYGELMLYISTKGKCKDCTPMNNTFLNKITQHGIHQYDIFDVCIFVKTLLEIYMHASRVNH